ncbi:MAG: glutamine--fructose-6-phosphate transaminase (isomerizing) [Pseudomonadota bacterium]
MCGIVGILGSDPVAPKLVDALKRLEYRGYDSAGVATLEDGALTRRRAEGKLGNLETRLSASPLSGLIGIGHTRWATHGPPIESNAHPHSTDRVAVVHNGIIENFQALRDALTADGARFQSDTDTEVVAHLVEAGLSRGLGPKDAVFEALQKLEGAFALLFLFQGQEDLLIAARTGSPLAVGYGDGEMFLGSDAIALSPFTDAVAYLEDGDWVVLTRSGADFYDLDGNTVTRKINRSNVGPLVVDKGNYRHFMAKEIHEQPEVIGHSLARYLDFANGTARADELAGINFQTVPRISMSACGTAYYAGLVGKYWFERHARLPVDIDVASEFRYRGVPLSDNGLAMFISQSGETADTLASLRYCRENGQTVSSIVNVPESTIARESDVVFQTLAGPEIGVASTKAFTCQLAVLAALAVRAARARRTISVDEESAMVRALSEVPRLCVEALKLEPQIEVLSKTLSKAEDVLYLGRNTNFPLALEGALKLKEISYIHAEGYAAGELKHGPIALIDEKMPVVVIAPHDEVFDKTVSNIQEVSARGGRIILITDARGADAAAVSTETTLILPDMAPFVAPLVYALPIQMLAYHTAVFMGTDVDQPRNLAKSVTVE